MKKSFVFLLASMLCVLAFAAPPSYLVTEKQFGAITKTTTYADLIKMFGKDKVKDEKRTGAEGEGEYTVTVVNKGTPQELEIGWPEGKLHTRIISVECTQLKSPYYTADSLKVGSTLATMVKVNKAYITFYGFEWDYGGTITDYHKGKLDGKKIGFSLLWKGKTNDTTLLGDGEFNTNMAKVKQRMSQVYISSISVSFEE